MNDYFLKASSEAALWESLLSAGLATKQYDPEDPLNTRPSEADTWEPTGSFFFVPNCQLDVIGVIYKPTGELTEEEGMQVPVMAPLDGFHANLRGELSAEQIAQLPLIEAPQAPYRVWA
jgi:hypothetical protein